jgi:hypothetical protein
MTNKSPALAELGYSGTVSRPPPNLPGLNYLTSEAVVLITAVQKLMLTKSAAPRPRIAVQFTRTPLMSFIPFKKSRMLPPQRILVVLFELFSLRCTRPASVSAL